MARSSTISMAVIRRLPRYFRVLNELQKKQIIRVSSGELSSLLGLTASQIRQDLNCFGGFGQQGYGYPVDQLRCEIEKILGLDSITDAVLIGAGNLGHAIANHLDFDQRGFHLAAVFDSAPSVIGSTVREMTVDSMENLESFCKEHTVKLAILCIPQEAAAPIVDRLIQLGVKCFWNFSHYDFAGIRDLVTVENVHLGDSLMTLSYRMKTAQ